jgi:hypothetical protein
MAVAVVKYDYVAITYIAYRAKNGVAVGELSATVR